jgi:hypothetical protein
MNTWGMSRDQKAFKFFWRRGFVFSDEDHFVARVEGLIRGERVPVIDDDIGVGLHLIFQLQEGDIGGDGYFFLIHLDADHLRGFCIHGDQIIE